MWRRLRTTFESGDVSVAATWKAPASVSSNRTATAATTGAAPLATAWTASCARRVRSARSADAPATGPTPTARAMGSPTTAAVSSATAPTQRRLRQGASASMKAARQRTAVPTCQGPWKKM